MEKIIDSEEYIVERAVLNDNVTFEGAEVVVSDERAHVIKYRGMHKAVFRDASDFYEYADKFGLYGDVCLLGAPLDAPSIFRFEATPCTTHAYFGYMPPVLELPHGVEIKRLAPSLAETVLEAYHNPGGGYTVDGISRIMREKGVFGAISGGKLAGFIGRHGDGSMGMLEVFEPFRGKGIGYVLEKFLIGYVMTFGRTPYCDVFEDNAASMHMQRRLGLTPGAGHTFWCEIAPRGE